MKIKKQTINSTKELRFLNYQSFKRSLQETNNQSSSNSTLNQSYYPPGNYLFNLQKTEDNKEKNNSSLNSTN